MKQLPSFINSPEKVELMTGFSKHYQPIDENKGEKLPPENKKVQETATDLLQEMANLQTELFDIEATKDITNCSARADLVINGKELLKQLPATTLLFLEKQLIDWRTMVDKIPTLDSSETWTFDSNQNFHKTEPVDTHRTQKDLKVITLAEATKEHPAQAQMVQQDQLVGYWKTVKMSGALPVPAKKALLERANKLLDAIKTAREQANMQPVQELKIGEAIHSFLLGGI